MKSQQLASIILCLFVSLISCLTLVSCFNAGPPDGYLGIDTQSVFFIQFTNKNNQLNGSIQGIEETNDIPANEVVNRSIYWHAKWIISNTYRLNLRVFIICCWYSKREYPGIRCTAIRRASTKRNIHRRINSTV